jgi:hypothetical protein
MKPNPKPKSFVQRMNLNPKTQDVCVKNEAQNPDQNERTATTTSCIGKIVMTQLWLPNVAGR